MSWSEAEWHKFVRGESIALLGSLAFYVAFIVIAVGFFRPPWGAMEWSLVVLFTAMTAVSISISLARRRAAKAKLAALKVPGLSIPPKVRRP